MDTVEQTVMLSSRLNLIRLHLRPAPALMSLLTFQRGGVLSGRLIPVLETTPTDGPGRVLNVPDPLVMCNLLKGCTFHLTFQKEPICSDTLTHAGTSFADAQNKE